MPGWQDEVVRAAAVRARAESGAATQQPWRCIGEARPDGRPGWFAVDVRGRPVDPDSLDAHGAWEPQIRPRAVGQPEQDRLHVVHREAPRLASAVQGMALVAKPLALALQRTVPRLTAQDA